MLTNVLQPQQAQPRDLSQRLLQRMYPADYGAVPQAPKSPTGLPVSTPPPPAPVAPRSTMAQPGYQTQAAAPAPVPTAQPQGGVGGVVGAIRGGLQGQSQVGSYTDLSPEHQKMVGDYFNSLKGIDYKGSHESALLQQAALAQLLRGWEAESPVDYTSAAPMADQFDRNRNQLEASLAARGLSGGVVGGALSNSYSQEARGIGDYIRQLVQQRDEQHHGDWQDFLRWTRTLNALGLQQNMAEQNDPGLWGDLLGIGGGILGKVAGGLIP